jgi:glycosyltransferase involved in cell wall biosynthesis
VRARYGLGDAVIVGWTGVIRDWHGLDLLLEAITPLSGARLLIVGDGPGRPAIESRAQSLGIAGRVAITGRVPHDEMPAHVAAMDVAVVADDRTGVASPMKLLEYMAMARAVVAPRLPNIEDVIVDGATGVLFTPGDAASLADALVTLTGAPAVRARLGRAARESILRERTWQRNAARVLEHVGPRSRETGVQRRG